MRALAALLLLSGSCFGACPPQWSPNVPELPPVLAFDPVVSGVGGQLCLGQPTCLFDDGAMPAPSVVVAGTSLQVTLTRQYLTDFGSNCGANSYAVVPLPRLSQGNYDVDYVIHYAIPGFGNFVFRESGQISVSGALQVPAMGLVGSLTLVFGIHVVWLWRRRCLHKPPS